ncbi:MAG TPA: hypothetical protein VG247_08035 [Pseudonocardiaceae bacterium]|jgi:hypothetical protein|nr:hypothetical protein [Pseudonocardiaceae bacterium]
MTELGMRISEFPTDNRRRIWTAVGLFVVGVIALGIGLGSIIEFDYVLGPDVPGGAPNLGPVPGWLVGIGIAGIGLGVVLLVLAARHRGERFALYEQGLVRTIAGRELELRWADIAAIRVVEPKRSTWLTRLLGGDLVCVLKLRTGGRLRFNEFTADARSLADWVRAAVEDGTTPRRP